MAAMSMSPLQLSPIAGRTEPLLWFQRFVIWSHSDSTPIRDLTLRPGLNILWSRPASGAFGNVLHLDVGHTSLVRLLRYCLGEASFGPKVHQNWIRHAFRYGAAGAELRVNGTVWSVIRPFRDSKPSVAANGMTLDTLWDEYQKGRETGFEDFTQAVTTAIAPRFAGNLKELFNLALGSVARDRDGGFEDVFVWHGPNNNSGLMMPRSERVSTLCALLGFKPPAKPKQVNPPSGGGNLSAAHGAGNNQSSAPKRVSGKQSQRGQNNGSSTAAEKAAAKRERDAKKKLDNAQESLRNTESDINDLKEKRGADEIKKNHLEAEASLLKRRVAEFKHELKQIYRYQVPPGTVCPPCHQDLKSVLTKGCLLSQAGCDPQTVNQKIAGITRKIGKCKFEIAKKRQRIRKLAGAVKKAIEGIEYETNTHLVRVQQHFDQAKENWLSACAQAARSQPNVAVKQPPGKAPTPNHSLAFGADPSETEALSEQNFNEFLDACQRIVHELVSPNASIEIQPGADGPVLRMLIGGEMRGSDAKLMKLLTFDFAVLLRSMEAPIHMPGLLIHDEPRQQDLSPSQYWALFWVARKLERSCPDERPLFQYIITTSSPPPKGLLQKPWILLELDAGLADVKGLLFTERSN